MKAETKKKILFIISGVLISVLIGFFIGRATIKPPAPTIKYIKGKTVYQTVTISDPVSQKPPVVDTGSIIKYCIDNNMYSDLFPVEYIENIIYEKIPVDTLAVIEAVMTDWLTEREYKETLFDDDTLGRMDIDLLVYKNRLDNLQYEYTPIYKEIALPPQIKKFSPFVGGGLTTLPSFVGQVGLFINDKYGASYIYQYGYDTDASYHGINLLLKF